MRFTVRFPLLYFIPCIAFCVGCSRESDTDRIAAFDRQTQRLWDVASKYEQAIRKHADATNGPEKALLKAEVNDLRWQLHEAVSKTKLTQSRLPMHRDWSKERELTYVQIQKIQDRMKDIEERLPRDASARQSLVQGSIPPTSKAIERALEQWQDLDWELHEARLKMTILQALDSP